MRRRPIDHTRKLPLIRSQKELALDDDTKVDAEQDEDTLNTSKEESQRLKDIPVPVSVPQQRAEGTSAFTLPKEFLRAPTPWVPPKAGGVELKEDDPVDWDVDPAGFRFLKALNKGEKEYKGPELAEENFEKIIDRFEKAVKADVLPELEALRTSLAYAAPDKSAIDACYAWWVQRRKQLAMPLIRGLRPAPDPEDPDTTGVAFRPREKEGVRRLRSNNKKTYALMSSLHDEFSRLKQLCDLIKRRERLKVDFHQASGEYVEAAHRTLLHRLHRQRTGQGGWKDDLDEDAGAPRPPVSHKKGAAAAAAAAAMASGGANRGALQPLGSAPRPQDRSHKKRHAGPGRPPKDGVMAPPPPGAPGAAASSSTSRPRDRDRDRDRHRSHRASTSSSAMPSSFVPGSYLTPHDGSEAMPSYEDVDSEEEAFNQLVLTVDTQRRDELVPYLPRHLRAAARSEVDEDAPLPHLDYVPPGMGAGQFRSPHAPLPPDAAAFGGMPSLGAAVAAVTAAQAAAPGVGAPATTAFAASAAMPASAAADGSAGTTTAAAAAVTGEGAPPGGAPAAVAPPSPLKRPADEPPREDGAERRQQPRVLIGRLRVGRGGRVLIDRGGRGSGPRYGRTCWRTVSSNGHLVPTFLAGPSSSSTAAAISAPAASSGGSGATTGGGSGALAGDDHARKRLAALPTPMMPPGGSGLSVGTEALRQMLQTGRVCQTAMLETHLDPDAAWRANKPLPIRQGPLLFNFGALPKPSLVPSRAELAAQPAAQAAAVGKKRARTEDAPNGQQ